jgi:hypothetical protein
MRPEIACGPKERIPAVMLGDRPGRKRSQDGKSNLFTLNRESLLGYLNLSCPLRNAMTVSQVPDQALERLEYLLDIKAALGTFVLFLLQSPGRHGSLCIWRLQDRWFHLTYVHRRTS